jgi:hypothetical protein
MIVQLLGGLKQPTMPLHKLCSCQAAEHSSKFCHSSHPQALVKTQR